MKFNIFRKSIKVESCSERITRHYGASNNVRKRNFTFDFRKIIEKRIRTKRFNSGAALAKIFNDYVVGSIHNKNAQPVDSDIWSGGIFNHFTILFERKH